MPYINSDVSAAWADARYLVIDRYIDANINIIAKNLVVNSVWNPPSPRLVGIIKQEISKAHDD